MKRMGVLLGMVAVAALAGVSSTVSAAVEEEHFNLESTEHLYLLCSAAPEDELYGEAILMCRGFLEGAVQYHDAIVGKERLKPLICHGQEGTVAESRIAFVEWATQNSDNSDLMGEKPVVGVVRALAVKYPCT